MRLLICLTLTFVLGCGEGPGLPSGEMVTYRQVLPVFQASCSPCHLGSLDPSSDLDLRRAEFLVEVPHEPTGLSLVEPGSPDESYLWLKLTDAHGTVSGGDGEGMPPTGGLAEEELGLVHRWILSGALAGEGPSDPGSLPCGDAPDGCATDCAPGPLEVTHSLWHNRLTESPVLSWTPVEGAVGYEASLGSTPDSDDTECWVDVGASNETSFTSIWVLQADATYYASVRAVFSDDRRSAPTSSSGWTVDIAPPAVPTSPRDDQAPIDGAVTWEHPVTDEGSGFDGFDIAVGSAPGADDLVGWRGVGTALAASLQNDLPGFPVGEWYWFSVRATDLAGNTSPLAISAGFITCPAHFAFVPGDDDLGTSPFCVSVYEMRRDEDNGGVPESRPTGLPWAEVGKGEARLECDRMGFDYQLLANSQWQTVARSIERTEANWSGGAVGVGELPRGHSDSDPPRALDADGSPCLDTNNPACEDPSSPDFSQRRTHLLHNGAVVWDLAGNLQEQVDGSAGAPGLYWMSFDTAVYTSEEGWEDNRVHFAPEGDFTEAQGVGRLYAGVGNLTRGGAWSSSGDSSEGSNTGVFGGHHNSWDTTERSGFRCVFVPM